MGKCRSSWHAEPALVFAAASLEPRRSEAEAQQQPVKSNIQSLTGILEETINSRRAKMWPESSASTTHRLERSKEILCVLPCASPL